MALFDVVAEPNRRHILDLLTDQERAVGKLVETLGLSQPAVSKHLRVLRDAGLVSVRGEAQRRLYRVHPEPLREIDDWLAPYRSRWASSLDALECHLTGSVVTATGAAAATVPSGPGSHSGTRRARAAAPRPETTTSARRART